MYVYIYVYIHVSIYIYIYIYILNARTPQRLLPPSVQASVAPFVSGVTTTSMVVNPFALKLAQDKARMWPRPKFVPSSLDSGNSIPG